MPSLFRKKQKKHTGPPTVFFRQGQFVCGGCGDPLPLEDYTPLTMGECQACGDSTFVPLRIAGFWLCVPLGGGGMGSVYAAYHEDAEDEQFAVKILPRRKKQDASLIQNLLDEAEVSSRISGHPCVVNFVDSGVEDDEHYLASELVRGERLDRRIDHGGKFTETETLLIGLQLLSAETHIYNHGYLYRDMKPQNVIMTEERGAVLYDYGLCMPVEDAVQDQRGDTFDGSVLYFPPERATGEGEHACSEIYSLGMVMYHVVTGKPFFAGEDAVNIAKRHISSLRLGTSPRMGKQGGKMKGIAPDLGDVIGRMTERPPHRRYQSFLAVERDLLEALVRRFGDGT